MTYIHSRSKADLSAMFTPRSVMAVGATEEKSRAGGLSLHALRSGGFSGPIYPVNRRLDTVQGLQAYPSIADCPETADLAIISLAPARIPDAVRGCGRKGVRAAVIFADGVVSDPVLGAEMRAAIAEAQSLSGLRILGPNTIGMRNRGAGLYATFAGDIDLPSRSGGVAFISQSGGMGTFFGGFLAALRGAGTRYLIDTGNEMDVDAADCALHVSGDPDVTCIGLMLEGAADGRKLTSAVAAAISRGKHVVFLKTGRSAAGQEQAASHTGALAGRAELFDEEMRRAGAFAVTNEGEMIDAMAVASQRRVPAGRGLGIVTPSGGFGVLTVDAADQYGIAVPQPSTPPSEGEKGSMANGKPGNPLDLAPTITSSRNTIETAICWMASQPDVDAVVLYQFYSTILEHRRISIVENLTGAAARTEKPIFVCGVAPEEVEDQLRQAGVLLFPEVTRLVRTLDLITRRHAPLATRPAEGESRGHGSAIVTGQQARDILAGIAHVASHPVETAAEAASLLTRYASRVVLKTESDAHAHKSELGLVVGPLTEAELDAGFAEITRARAACGAATTPIVLQPFERGVELALGAYVDPVFGPAVMVASGGIFLEILKDAAFAAAPIDLVRAQEMILGLKGSPLLLGARGKPVADVDAAAQVLVELSRFIAEHHRDYAEIDINPLIVRDRGKGAVAVDALLIRAKEVA